MEKELKNFSCMGLGGKGEIFMPESEKQLLSLLNKYKNAKVFGNGSNILFGNNFDSPLITTRYIKKKKKIVGNLLYCNLSCTLFELYKLTSSRSLAGFEKLALIPANLGGAIKNNASCFGQGIFDNLVKVKIYDRKKGKCFWINKRDVVSSYHSTDISGVILAAKFSLPVASPCLILKRFLECKEKRLSTQPIGKSLGSIFKNPPNDSAGRLIEKCGLKGFQIGDAKISQKHANMFLNLGNATFEDMTALINLAKESVKEKFGITLEEEIEIVGSKKE